MDILQDQQFNMRFVKTVKKYPVLYNTDLKEYAKRDCRERAWIEVSEEMNCDPKDAKKKWKNFRSILLRYVKKLQMGASVPKYYLYDHLKYLIPHMKTYEPGTLKRTLIQPVQKPGTLKRTLIQPVQKVSEPAAAEYETESDPSIEDIELDEDMMENSHDPIYLENYETYENSLPKKRKLVSSEDEVETYDDEDLVSLPAENFMFKDKVTNCTSIQAASTPASYTRQRDQTVSSESPKRQFVLSLLPDLNEMTNSQMRKFKCKVVQLIDEILNENNT